MLLGHEPPGRHLSVDTLARQLGGLSRNHLHKIIRELAALGVVRTVRGAGGGALLAVSPEEVRLGALVRRLEADQALVECCRADGGHCVLTPGCRLRGMLCDAQDSFYDSLDQHTLADCLPLAAAGLTSERPSPMSKPCPTPLPAPARR
nr:Rrf2 family transcriptional regulator [Limobrevibacterium gyesilva]